MVITSVHQLTGDYIITLITANIMTLMYRHLITLFIKIKSILCLYKMIYIFPLQLKNYNDESFTTPKFIVSTWQNEIINSILNFLCSALVVIVYTIHNTQYTIYNTQYTIHNTQYTIHNTHYTIHNIYNTQYTIHNTHDNTSSGYTVSMMSVNDVII